MNIVITEKNRFMVQVGSHVRIQFDHVFFEEPHMNDFWATITEIDQEHIYYKRDDGWKGEPTINYFPDLDLWKDHTCHICYVQEVDIDHYVCKEPTPYHPAKRQLLKFLTNELHFKRVSFLAETRKSKIINLPRTHRMMDIYPGFNKRAETVPFLIQEAGMVKFVKKNQAKAWGFQDLIMAAAVYLPKLTKQIDYDKAADVWIKQNRPHLVNEDRFDGLTVSWQPFKKWVRSNHHRFLLTKAEIAKREKELEDYEYKMYQKDMEADTWDSL